MELRDRVVQVLSGGKTMDRFETYRSLYTEITGKQYNKNCRGCAVNYLFRYLTGWIKNK